MCRFAIETRWRGVVTGRRFDLRCASWTLGAMGLRTPTGSGAGVISEGGLGMTIGVACEPSSAGGAWARRRQLSTREAKGMRWVSLPGSGGKGTHPGLHQIAISRRRRQSGSPRRTSFGVLVLISSQETVSSRCFVHGECSFDTRGCVAVASLQIEASMRGVRLGEALLREKAFEIQSIPQLRLVPANRY